MNTTNQGVLLTPPIKQQTGMENSDKCFLANSLEGANPPQELKGFRRDRDVSTPSPGRPSPAQNGCTPWWEIIFYTGWITTLLFWIITITD